MKGKGNNNLIILHLDSSSRDNSPIKDKIQLRKSIPKVWDRLNKGKFRSNSHLNKLNFSLN